MGALDRIWLPPSIDNASRATPTGWLAEQRRDKPATSPVTLNRAQRRARGIRKPKPPRRF